MNIINLCTIIFILLVACTTDESEKIKNIKNIEKSTLIAEQEFKILDSTIIEENLIVNENLDSSRNLPSYFDYESVTLLYLKQHIGKVYNEELYNKFIDSNRNKLMKLIEEYDQKRKIELDTDLRN